MPCTRQEKNAKKRKKKLDKCINIVIKPVKKSRLSEMLDNINDQNIHQEVDWGKPVGKETW
jgi:antitoxin component of MazEF toxin-antitoxin module